MGGGRGALHILCNFSLCCMSSWPGLRVRASCVSVFHNVNVIMVQAWGACVVVQDTLREG